jgi:hypothetical protein
MKMLNPSKFLPWRILGNEVIFFFIKVADVQVGSWDINTGCPRR